MPKYKLMIAQFPGGNSTHPDVAGWVHQTAVKAAADPRISEIVPFRISTTPITMGRNKACRMALETQCDYILMIDSDMSPDLYLGKDPEAVPFWDSAWEFAMQRRDKPVMLAAPYCGPPPHENVFVFRWANFESDCPQDVQPFKIEQFGREEAALRSGWERCPCAATGILLIDTRVFQQLAPPWFEYEYTDRFQSDLSSTEDCFFTRNAAVLPDPGCDVWVNWNAWAGHWKAKCVGKPVVTPADAIHQSLHQAVRAGIQSNQRLVIVGGGNAPSPTAKKAEPQPA